MAFDKVPMSTNCASLIVDMFLYSHRGFSKKNEKNLVRSFNFTFRYTDDVISLINLVILLIASIPLSLK